MVIPSRALCPRCNGWLVGIVKVTMHAPVIVVSDDPTYPLLDWENQQAWDSEILEIRCEGCKTSWPTRVELRQELEADVPSYPLEETYHDEY